MSVNEKKTLRTLGGVFSPYTMAIRNDRRVVVDSQIVKESIFLANAHERKVTKYQNERVDNLISYKVEQGVREVG